MSSDSSLGEAVLDITGDDSPLRDTISNTKGWVSDALDGMGKLGGTLFKAGLLAAGAGLAIISKELYDSVQAASDAQQVQAQLNAVLESTGGIAGISADEVNGYANELRNLTGIDDDAIVSAESMLLTFTDIGKNVFPDATKTVLDMATAMNGGALPTMEELRQQSVQLGKALQDPDTGLGVLKKVGVNVEELEKKFTPFMSKEEKQILILQELQTEFGGSAEAAGKTFAGQLALLQSRLGDIQETVGAALLPVLSDLAAMFNEYLMKPEVQAFIQEFAKSLGEFAQQAIRNIPVVIQMFKDVFGWLMENEGIIVGVLTALGSAIAVFLWTSLAPMLPVIAMMALIGAAAYLLYTAWTENWGGIQEKMGAVWAVVQPILQQIWNWLQVNVPLAIQALSNYWQNVLLPAIQFVWSWIQTNVFPLLAALWSWLATNIPLALQALSTFWTGTLLPALQAVWGWMNGTLFPFFRALWNFLSAVFNVAVTAMAGVWQNVLYPALKNVHAWLSEKLMPIFQTLATFWQTTLQPIAQAIAQWFGEKVVGAFQSLTSILQTVTTWLNNVAATLGSMTLPSWMTPGSPTPWEIGLWGVNDALKAVGNLSLPNLSGSMSMMPSPAIAGGNISIGGGSAAMPPVQFVYQPFVGVNDEYEAKNKLRSIVSDLNREASRK